jgi:NSS family neurotransmitter:Na+ symporter
MPFGSIFIAFFFILAGIAATGAMLSLLEVPVAYLNEEFHLSRTKATIITVVLLALVGSTAALSNSTLADFKLFGMTMFDLFDYVTSNILLPVGGLFITIFTGWVWGKDKIKQALSNEGGLKNEALINIFIGIVRFVTPVLVFVVLLNGLHLI